MSGNTRRWYHNVGGGGWLYEDGNPVLRIPMGHPWAESRIRLWLGGLTARRVFRSGCRAISLGSGATHVAGPVQLPGGTACFS